MSDTNRRPDVESDVRVALVRIKPRSVFLTVAWLPFVALLFGVLSMFLPILNRLAEKGSLHWMLHWLTRIGQWNPQLTGLLAFSLMVALVVSDQLVARGASNVSHGRAIYRFWLTVSSGSGLLAMLMLLWGLMLQSFVFPGHK